jgi:MoaA/NifB/PqqE/SkfB family radical SAM enzyme
MLKSIPKIIRHAGKRQPLNSSTEVRLTWHCTQRCRQCRVYERNTQPVMMSLSQFRLLAERLRSYGAFLGFISGGEALLVPDLHAILLEAKKTFSIATTLVTGLYHRRDVVRETAALCLENDINIQTSFDGLAETGDLLRGVKHFSDTLLDHMAMIAGMRGSSRSLLYANIVLNDYNLEQVPELIKRVRSLGWRATIGLYHHLTETTRSDDDLAIIPDERLERLLAFLDHNPDILNLNSFIRGIGPFLKSGSTTPCPFVASRVAMTRTTIMENGDVHLCWGGPIGNIFTHSLAEIFSGPAYKELLRQYADCPGCWTTCYTQRYLLVKPRSVAEFIDNSKKMIRLRSYMQQEKR